MRFFLLLIALFIFSNVLNAQERYRVTADQLRIRETNDSKSKIISTVPQNNEVMVLDAADPKFYKIRFKNIEGWASKDFLQKVTPDAAPTNQSANAANNNSPAPATTDLDMYQVTADDLRVRAQANPKSKIVGYLPKGENVAVIDSTNASFFKIKVTNGEGWVSKEFLKRISPIKAPVKKNTISASVPQSSKDYTGIIFIAVIAIILFTILYFSLKYASGNKLIIGFAVLVVLVVGYLCYITFIAEKNISGNYASTEDVQYKDFNFKSKDSVTVSDAYNDTTFTSKYIIEGDMIKLYDQQNTIMLLIRDENTLIGEGFTRGTFMKK